MEAQPLSKKIYNKAKKLGVEQIVLEFSGGSDEGYLHIEMQSRNLQNPKQNHDFAQEIEDWAWEAYSYSGAGDGSDYGDNITYDLVNGEVSTEEWYSAPQTTSYPSSKLEIAGE
jgi:hypothetical protein